MSLRFGFQVDMQFDAEIVPSVTSMMVGTPLKLFMNLTTETSWGATRRCVVAKLALCEFLC